MSSEIKATFRHPKFDLTTERDDEARQTHDEEQDTGKPCFEEIVSLL